jgi:hypothetical protein
VPSSKIFINILVKITIKNNVTPYFFYLIQKNFVRKKTMVDIVTVISLNVRKNEGWLNIEKAAGCASKSPFPNHPCLSLGQSLILIVHFHDC